ncbi:DUF58 domain-containing protein [Crateriforma conspicua]|uniref:VWA domain containing CoxE-like protein n=1 Tax=Crateriforma conspicua TaxID=2527996 RepID=A0A5C6FTZ6_9PLAN|nr:DUF58 domain-containing protein [Crateriforma conspicua]TWU66512.1 VWA domain containing CoxE-like protein [Crateriforma conspicua]
MTDVGTNRLSLRQWIAAKDFDRVARLQVFAREVVEGFCSGRHRSPQKGYSVDFKEHRQYVRGDELRDIDWKVYGKSDKLFVRQYEEETNLRCHLVVDTSGSMAYGGDHSKADFATRLAACLTYMMLGQQDAVGLITFDDRPRSVVQASGRPSHLTQVLSALVAHTPQNETDLGTALRLAAGQIRRRALVVILSDGMGDVRSMKTALAMFRNHGHDVIFFQILHPDESEFPFQGRIRFRDLEHDTTERTVDSSTIRQAYLDRFAQHQDDLKSICRTHRVDLVTLSSAVDPVEGLHRYVTLRRATR